MAKKLYILVDGGLGNQLFQYSFGRAVAERVANVDVHFDSTMFRLRRKSRSFLLDQLVGGNDKSATSLFVLFALLLKKKLSIQRLRRLGLITEPVETFDQAAEAIACNQRSYVHGYWQDSELAVHGREHLQNVLRIRYGDAVAACCKDNDIDLQNDVAIHIRRGDYVASRHTRRIFYTCTDQYYIRALLEMKKKHSIRKVHVFSDDLEWCRSIFTGTDCRFVDFVGDVLTEFALMSSFKNIIISNSTFSWWAAFCNINERKNVVAPEIWKRGLSIRSTKLFVKNWQLVPNVMPHDYKNGISRLSSKAYRNILPKVLIRHLDILRSYHRATSTGFVFVHNPRAAGVAISRSIYGKQIQHIPIYRLRRWGGQTLNRLPAIAIIRDPVSRLISAYRHTCWGGTAVVKAAWRSEYTELAFLDFESFVSEWLLKRSGQLESLDYVFWPQSAMVCINGQIAVDYLLNFHRLTEGLNELAGEGIEIRPPTITNESRGAPIEPSSQCIEIIKRIYASDYAQLGDVFSTALWRSPQAHNRKLPRRPFRDRPK